MTAAGQGDAHSRTGEDLVDRIRRGDSDAEAALVARYARGVRMIVGRGTRDRSCIDDVCQETFRVALEKIRRGDVREPSRLPGFIASLARNMIVDHFRRWRRQEPLVDAAEESDRAPDQLERLLMQEQAGLVRTVLAGLPSERDRQILFRYYVAEDSKAQICQDLGLSSLHFNRVLFRARERYRVLYEASAGRRSGT